MGWGGARRRNLTPRALKARGIYNTQKGSAPFRKFSTLLHFSTAYKSARLHRCDAIRPVLTIELLQFYYSGFQQTVDPADSSPLT
jgi:hypothetical protein